MSTFEKLIPEQAKKILENCDKLKAYGNNPFFDYYWLAYQAIDTDNLFNGKKWAFNDNGKISEFDTQDQINLCLDEKLIQSKITFPLIIGEKDGKSYFVCFWC